MLEDLGGDVFSDDNCSSSVPEVSAGYRPVFDVVINEGISVVLWPWPGIVVFVFVVVSAGILIELSASGERVDVSEVAAVGRSREYKRLAWDPPQA